jgi:hypothetical protein
VNFFDWRLLGTAACVLARKLTATLVAVDVQQISLKNKVECCLLHSRLCAELTFL